MRRYKPILGGKSSLSFLVRTWIKDDISTFSGHPGLPRRINCAVHRDLLEHSVCRWHVLWALFWLATIERYVIRLERRVGTVSSEGYTLLAILPTVDRRINAS